MYKIIHKNYSHHHPATPIDTAGSWKVYSHSDVEEGWPNNGHCLALDMTSENLAILKSLGDKDPDQLWELPPEVMQEEA